MVLVLATAATVGAADLFRGPGETGGSIEKASAQDLLDPDAPIATARYREPSPRALAAAGLAPPPVQLAQAEPTAIQLDDPPVARDPMRYQMAQMSPPARVKVQAAIAARADAGMQPPDPQALAVLSMADDARTGGRGGSLSDDAKELLIKIAPSREDARRGRWFLFAAASGKAFGLNMVRDGEAGLRRAGWSVERLATWGKGQVGVGWRRKNLQASLAVARREIGDLGVYVDDTLAGYTLSWRPQDETP